MRVRVDDAACQGHGRCYDLAPAVFSEDDEGYGHAIGDGTVPPTEERNALLAVRNCPENAVVLLEAAVPQESA